MILGRENFLSQIREEFVISFLSEFVRTNSMTWNNDVLEFVISIFEIVTSNSEILQICYNELNSL